KEVVADLTRRMVTARADGYYVLHNHPAGRSLPSQGDQVATRVIANGVIGFRGHVVIDHNEYSTIDRTGNFKTYTKDFGGYDPVANPRVPHPLLNAVIDDKETLAVTG